MADDTKHSNRYLPCNSDRRVATLARKRKEFEDNENPEIYDPSNLPKEALNIIEAYSFGVYLNY
ncbi:28_t:CDS:2 [Diversispora eburnea]|uniref:28_t:CDS:1 n=1 Tax=Diversispora eburnea TaxID=1213867 RepID=A0A9N8W3V5_9GLOM|nr:28_t:CDS:2 [Diversispora eburnea]